VPFEDSGPGEDGPNVFSGCVAGVRMVRTALRRLFEKPKVKIQLADSLINAEIEAHDLELETICPGTTGEGCTLGRNKSGGTCGTCHGRGIVPTLLGRKILAFVISHAAQYRKDNKLK
jgi:hypothetical protein